MAASSDPYFTDVGITNQPEGVLRGEVKQPFSGEANFGRYDLDLTVDIVFSQIEAVDHGTCAIPCGVHVSLFVDSIKNATREIGFQPAICSHTLLLGLANSRVGMRAADTQIATGRGIPPKDEGIAIVGSQVDVNIEGKTISEVVVS